MSDKYEYGPWVGWNGGKCPVAASAIVQPCLRRWGESDPAPAGSWRWTHSEVAAGADIIAYRIATPKPKRELVVGKWYLSRAGHWRRVIAIEHNNEHGAVWMTPFDSPDEASLWKMSSALDVIDWSTPPRDEAPE